MKHTLFTALVFLFSVCAYASKSNIYRAQFAFASDSLELVMNIVNYELSKDKKNSDAYAMRGCVIFLTDCNKAIKEYTTAIKYYKDGRVFTKSQLYSFRGACYEELKNYDDAIKDYSAALKSDDSTCGDTENFFLAGCYYNKKDTVNFLKCINSAISCNPRYANAYYLRARYYYETNDYKRALDDVFSYYDNCTQYKDIEYLEKLYEKELQYSLSLVSERIQSHGDSYEWYYIRAYMYFSRGLYDEAIKDLNTILSSYSSNINSIHLRSSCNYNKMNYEEAIKDLNRLVELDSITRIYRQNRADCLSYIGKFQEAIDDCTVLINNEPSVGELYFKRGCYKELQRDFEGALADYNKGLLMESDNLNLHVARGNLLFRNADTIKAKVDFEFVLKNDTVPNVDSHRQLALARMGHTDEAVEWMDKIIADYNQSHPILDYQYAYLYVIIGDAEKSLDYLYKAFDGGFNIWAYLFNGWEFDTIRENKRYLELVERYRDNKQNGLPNTVKSE